jgi:hypothetical protein
MWLGGTDLATEGTWLWESTKEPIIYTHWDTHSAIEEFKSQQPDNLGNANFIPHQDLLSMLYKSIQVKEKTCIVGVASWAEIHQALLSQFSLIAEFLLEKC